MAAALVGRRRYFIDLTNWGRVDGWYRPFLLNKGMPPGLSRGVVDVRPYVEEALSVYREAVEELGEMDRGLARTLARLWAFRFFLPWRLAVDREAAERRARLWEVRSHVEDVVGRRFEEPSEVYVGRVRLEVRGSAVHVGGVPSLGHTYLSLIGVLRPDQL